MTRVGIIVGTAHPMMGPWILEPGLTPPGKRGQARLRIAPKLVHEAFGRGFRPPSGGASGRLTMSS